MILQKDVRMFTNTRTRGQSAALHAAGLLECPHMEHEVPHWKRDKKRGALVQSIMASDRTMYLRQEGAPVL